VLTLDRMEPVKKAAHIAMHLPHKTLCGWLRNGARKMAETGGGKRASESCGRPTDSKTRADQDLSHTHKPVAPQ
jgi:hypothetical protein